MENGMPAAHNQVAANMKAFLADTSITPAFRRRVLDALEKLKNGESNGTIRETHGGIVLRQALALVVKCTSS